MHDDFFFIGLKRNEGRKAQRFSTPQPTPDGMILPTDRARIGQRLFRSAWAISGRTGRIEVTSVTTDPAAAPHAREYLSRLPGSVGLCRNAHWNRRQRSRPNDIGFL
ncbi:hypothetical protein G3N95_02135 [Paraburkholderia sp. Tr-20389]|uniref:hypothetical protein n=1 Tax=Paraburkholderia sp. Tr-20389 TaxID=2703903 RepID=UPI00197F0853|nr:hypothetical protein [Paraburkholderia sp. Tr-20389]MBN3751721.1 hypothetical protein [Paraburkholderia sp. Tr-20389]